MPREKGPEWVHVVILSENDKNAAFSKLKCIYCEREYTGGVCRIRAHLNGSGDIHIKACQNVPDDVMQKFQEDKNERAKQEILKRKREALDAATKVKIVSKTHDSQAHASTSKQGTLPGMFQLGSKQFADAALARCFYANGIPFVVAESKYFKEMLEAVIRCGPGYRPPSRSALANKLLENEVLEVEKQLSEYKRQMTVLGGTIVSDGWTNVQNRPMINTLVVTGDGTMFVDGIDTSGQTKSAEFIAQDLSKTITSIGSENIVQVVTDSAANCVGARRILNEQFPSITSSPCAAHCIDLLLEDIGKLQWAHAVIQDGHTIVKFLTTHHASLAYFRSHSKNLELLKPGETRFANFFIMLQRLQECKDALQETVTNREYKKWVSTPKYSTMGNSVTDMILDNRFWSKLSQLTSVCEPIVSLLRLVDGAVPCVGKVYWRMFQIDQHIESCDLEQAKKTEVRRFVAARWKMMHTDLHSAGFVLDPEYREFLQHENDEVISGFHAMIEKIHQNDVQAQVKAIQQHSIYRAGQGLFARPVAMAAAKEMPPFRWWMAFGAHVPELQTVAVRVLSQVASASSCERNWSTFDFIHTKKRNRLKCKRVRNIVFVHSNLRLADKLADLTYKQDTIDWDSTSSEDDDD